MPIAPLRTLAPQRSPLILPDEIGGNCLLMPFNEGVGDPQDYSGYNSHGTRVGAVWAPDSRGRAGHALDFNPTIPSYVTIPAAHTQLDFTSEDFSIVMRVKIDSLSSHRVLYRKTVGATEGYGIMVRTTGACFFDTWQALASQRTVTAGGAFVIGTTYTIGSSRAGANVRLYRNGIDITAVPGAHIDPASSFSTALIGIHQNLLIVPLDGIMEFIFIFGGIALTASQHMAIHLGARIPNLRTLAVVR